MDSFAYSCDKAGKPLIDINDQWKPFVPAWYIDEHSPRTSSTAPSATGATQTSVVPMADHKMLSTGAIAGIGVGVGCLFLALILAGLVFYRRSKKKLKETEREKAVMADKLHDGRGGVDSRINELQYSDIPPPKTSEDSLGTTAVNTWVQKPNETGFFQPDYYTPNPTAPSSIYDTPEKSPSDLAHWNAGYRPPVRSPPPALRSPPPRPYRPDDDEILPVRRSTSSALHEAHGSPVYNERGVKTQSWMSPVMTASHTSPVYGVDGDTIGYRQSGT